MMGFGSYKTARYLIMRIRAGLVDPEFGELMGIVEVDETYIGGKKKNRHWDKKTPGTGGAGKISVMGAIEHKGAAVAGVVYHVDTATADAFVNESVSGKGDLVATDESGVCHKAGRKRPHQFVTHGRGEYVRGEVHTHTIDDFWSLPKRRIIGTFHNVSRKYLPHYVAQFEFRHNNMNNPDIFGAAVARC